MQYKVILSYVDSDIYVEYYTLSPTGLGKDIENLYLQVGYSKTFWAYTQPLIQMLIQYLRMERETSTFLLDAGQLEL